jgi:hypothetical protein
MKKSLLLILVLLLLASFCSPQKKESLFNGKDLTRRSILPLNN